MYTFTVNNNRNRDIERVLAFEGQAQVVQFNLAPWEDVNGTVTAATWTVVSGSVGVSGESLSGSVASALITTSSSGKSLVKVSLTSGTDIELVYLEIAAKDPDIVLENMTEYV